MMAFFAFSAHAGAPGEFKDVNDAKKWFANAYPTYEYRLERVKNDTSIQVHAFYGPRGSGVVRVDGWYFDCIDGAGCSLIAMMNLGDAKKMKSPPVIERKNTNLIIKSQSGNSIYLKIQ